MLVDQMSLTEVVDRKVHRSWTEGIAVGIVDCCKEEVLVVAFAFGSLKLLFFVVLWGFEIAWKR